jgi:hypothetical protein
MTNPHNSVFYEWRDDGVLFHLEDGVKALVRWATATKHHVELWPI